MSLKYITIILFLLSTVLSAQVTITNTDSYNTAYQLFLANEINESGEPFAEELGYNLDDLDPMVLDSPDSIAYALGIENYEYSRYQLGTIVSRSGMGLHMMWGPVIVANAAMQDSSFDGSITGTPNGFNEDDFLVKSIMHFGMLANQMPPQNPWPQFAEFISGNPHLPQKVDPVNFSTDFSTLRWDRSLMDKTLNPAAMGQSLMKQYLWAQDMLGSFHDADNNDVDPQTNSPDSVGSPNFDPDNNVFYGGNALDGFIGQVLTAEAINKMKFITNALAYDGSSLGAVHPATYDPANGIKYFPHKIAVTEEPVAEGLPPRLASLSVVDASSDLFDQLSLFWGTLNFKNMMDPDNNESAAHAAYHHVFDGDPFPPAASQSGSPGPFDLMKGSSKVIFLNLKAMHFNDTEGTFVNISNLSNGNVVQGDEISTLNIGYVLVMLEKFITEFAGTPLETSATEMLNSQANFLITNLKNSSGGYQNSYVIGVGKDANAENVISIAGAIRGLYAAYSATNNNVYLTEANSAYSYFINNFYLPSKMAFVTELGNPVATYTPFNFAVIAGALREAVLVGGNTEAAYIYTRFFKSVGNKMQLSEAGSTGETGNDSDGDGIPFIPEQAENLPPIFAPEATLDLITGIVDNGSLVYKFELEQNYPNPFNPSTEIIYHVPSTGNVSLKIYNILGKEISTLFNGVKAKGTYTFNFNSQNYGLASGIYLYKLSQNNQVSVKKMILMK